MNLSAIRFVVLAWGLFLTGNALSFPEMTRHGYANCMTCHVSPDGGGVMTAYGRSLSREVLSTWGAEGEEKPLYFINPPEWLLLGGDVRWIQTFYKNSTTERAKSIFMQADVEAAAQIEQWSAVVSVGRQASTSNNFTGSPIFTRRHYVRYSPTDTLSFRVGKFMLPYGINLPDHFVGIKRSLRWDEGAESYNLEAAYLGENYDLFLTGSIGRPDDATLNRDKGVSLRGSTFLNERYKVGASYFFGDSPLGQRHVAGPYAILGFTKDWFVLAELDFQHLSPPTGTSKDGIVSYLRVNHEITKGVHGYAVHEYGKTDLKQARTEVHSFGLGAQFFPRPHWEINASWQKQKIQALGNEYADFAYAMIHFYL